MKKHFVLALLAVGVASAAMAQGGLSQSDIDKMRESYKPTPAERALRNALNTADINTLAINTDAAGNLDGNDFTYRVPTVGITNQKSSGRCWLFTGLNMLRAQAIRQHNLKELKLSQAYNFFYDQLEKANLFLQLMIDTADKPMDDRNVEWLFAHPIADGGTFTGVADIVSKYGVVPASAMSETYVTEHTATYRKLMGQKLREWGLELRRMVEQGKPVAEIEARKQAMLGDVYHVLCQLMGVPPTQFEYAGKIWTPQEFYKEYFGNDLKNNYVMFMNDPTRPYYKMYEINYDRHAYDGQNWTYLNVPMSDIKEMAIASLKDSTAMYFSSDVGKFLIRKDGTLDLENYDYGAILGIDFTMDKKDRILTGSSASSHAMTLEGVELDAKGQPVKWLIENSWGVDTGRKGYAVATDQWMDEYLFRLVVERRFVPKKLQGMLSQKPILLPAWDILF